MLLARPDMLREQARECGRIERRQVGEHDSDVSNTARSNRSFCSPDRSIQPCAFRFGQELETVAVRYVLHRRLGRDDEHAGNRRHGRELVEHMLAHRLGDCGALHGPGNRCEPPLGLAKRLDGNDDPRPAHGSPVILMPVWHLNCRLSVMSTEVNASAATALASGPAWKGRMPAARTSSATV